MLRPHKQTHTHTHTHTHITWSVFPYPQPRNNSPWLCASYHCCGAESQKEESCRKYHLIPRAVANLGLATKTCPMSREHGHVRTWMTQQIVAKLHMLNFFALFFCHSVYQQEVDFRNVEWDKRRKAEREVSIWVWIRNEAQDTHVVVAMMLQKTFHGARFQPCLLCAACVQTITRFLCEHECGLLFLKYKHPAFSPSQHINDSRCIHALRCVCCTHTHTYMSEHHTNSSRFVYVQYFQSHKQKSSCYVGSVATALSNVAGLKNFGSVNITGLKNKVE